MMSAILFGLALNPIYNAIAEVESNRGATSSNIYQISSIYLNDLNRIYICHYPDSVKTDKVASERVMYDYWRFYAYLWAKKNAGKPITYEVLARIHNGGPNGMSNPKTILYWRKVRRHLMDEIARSGIKVDDTVIDSTP